jgi:hypothetical protein
LFPFTGLFPPFTANFSFFFFVVIIIIFSNHHFHLCIILLHHHFASFPVAVNQLAVEVPMAEQRGLLEMLCSLN